MVFATTSSLTFVAAKRKSFKIDAPNYPEPFKEWGKAGLLVGMFQEFVRSRVGEPVDQWTEVEVAARPAPSLAPPHPPHPTLSSLSLR